ncbi:MAG: hypothetical protein ABDK94_02675 [Atribacterota bacterium]
MKCFVLTCTFLVFALSFGALANENPNLLILPDSTVIDTKKESSLSILGSGNLNSGETRSGLPSFSRPGEPPGLPPIGGTTTEPSPGLPSPGATPQAPLSLPASGGLLPNLGGQTQPGGITITPPTSGYYSVETV